jgi:hypothetical protein
MRAQLWLESLKRLIARPRRRWEGNIKMDFWEKGLEDVDRIQLVQDRDRWRALVNTVTKLQVPLRAGNFFSRKIVLYGGLILIFRFVNYLMRFPK